MSNLASKVNKLKERFEIRGLTLSCAESCTGGLLSATISSQPGISSFFLGAIVSYHRSFKNKILQVPLSLLDVVGEVSLPVATKMAQGARAVTGSNWAVAITGVAGPTGGTLDKPVGLVCFAIAGPGFSISEIKKFDKNLMREEIQRLSVEYALDLLLKCTM
ncbi:MAG: hypothetical protein A2Z20_03810 [Bdellovibrionales bacterium RBG_16_40_8]|nr:MAG: hypothetical protein A2Z20_03810 [Bdellovibrionales bacterium RBG_16_40_8]